jgi:PAS domain S-box-containing protein
MDILAIEKICYRILLSIGNSLELRKMLGTCLTCYMQELSCDIGAVLLLQDSETNTQTLQVQFSIPKSIERNPDFQNLLLELMHETLSEEYVIKTDINKFGFFHIFSLSDIGILVLHTKQMPMDQTMIGELLPLNKKLAVACKACMQNEKLMVTNQQYKEMANMLPGIIVEIDLNYKVTFYNARTREIFKQVDSEQFNPQSIFDFIIPAEQPKIRRLLERCYRDKTIVADDFVMQNSRSEQFIVNVIIAPILAGQKPIGYRGIATDISKRVSLERELVLRDRLLNAITLSILGLLKSQDYTKSIPQALKLLGNATGVDRVYYFKNNFDDENTIVTTSQKAEWSIDSVTPQIDNPELQDVPIEAVELFFAPLFKRKPFIALIEELPECITKEILQSQDIKSILVLPIFIKETLWGFVGFDDCRQNRRWSTVERDLLELFSTSISEAIERKQSEEAIRLLYSEIMDDLEVAQSIQKSVLPPWFKKNEHLLISADYQPWAKIGGDFYDCIELPHNKYAIYIADISGHGIQAALTMTAIKAIFNIIIQSEKMDPEPAKVVSKLNAIISKQFLQDTYVTLNYCLVDIDKMTLTNLCAGHPPVLLVNQKTKTSKTLETKGDIPLGWIKEYQYSADNCETVHIDESDIVWMMTDGVFESFNAQKELLGMTNLHHHLVSLSLKEPCILLPHACYDLVNSLGYTNHNDDFSCFTFTIHTNTKDRYLEVPPSLEAVEQAAMSCYDIALEFGSSIELAENARLIAMEFMTNIVDYGFTDSVSEMIALHIKAEDSLSLTFYDNAKAWDLPAKSEHAPDFFDLLNEQATPSGRGMQIIYALTTEAVRRRIHQTNETRFVLTQ